MMNSGMRYSGKEIGIGVLIVALTGGLLFAGFKYAHLERFWKKRQEIFVVFAGVGGLTFDAPVRYNGIEVGRVKSMEPIHFDDKKINDHLRVLAKSDLNNLPIRDDNLKHELRNLPKGELDKAVREKLKNTTMIKVGLEVLSEDDPIRYRIDDEVRIVKSIFGDTAIEMSSGSGLVHEDPRKQFLLGNAGNFFTNILMSMGEMKEIADQVTTVFGDKERESISKFESRFTPINKRIDALSKDATKRIAGTTEKFSQATKSTKAQLDKIRESLESLEPSAQKATNSIQGALKEIKAESEAAEVEFTSAKQEITKEYKATMDALQQPYDQVRQGLNDASGDFLAAKATMERAPARIDTAMDPLGSIPDQSEEDMERFAKALPRIITNLKIAGYVAKENKDLMLGNRDVGEYAAQSALDIHHRLGSITRRITQASGDAVDAALSVQSDMLADPVIERARATAKTLDELRAPIEDLRDMTDRIFVKPWTERKRASWFGDGPIRWE